jgi:hypothetical protein
MQINLHWIQRWAERYSGQKGDMAASVAETAATVLLLEESADAAASQLLEVMGDGAAEDIMMLMENRCAFEGVRRICVLRK